MSGLPTGQVRVELTRDDIALAGRFIATYRRFTLMMRGLVAALVVVGAVIAAEGPWAPAIGFFAVAAAFGFGFPTMLRGRQAQWASGASGSYSFDVDGFEFVQPERRERVAWSELVRVFADGPVVMLWVDKNAPFIVPKRAFSSEEEAAAVATTAAEAVSRR